MYVPLLPNQSLLCCNVGGSGEEEGEAEDKKGGGMGWKWGL